jgi:hypothetical protein
VATNPDWPGLLNGVNHLLFFPMGMPTADWIYAPLVPLLHLAPWLLVAVDWRQIGVFHVVLLLWVVVVPETFMQTFFVVSRFAVFLLPFYALVFSPSEPARARKSWGMLGLAALCWAFVAIQAVRLIAFARESQSFEEVLAAASPGYRAQQLVLDVGSEAAWTPMAYTNFPLWYQAEKSGLVDFNFAQFAAQIVRYRDPKAEAGKPASAYRYFFVRSLRPLPATFFAPGACQPVLRKSSGSWSLFENANCPRP